MDVLWVILDSLSFGATPFATEGPETMPKLSALAEDSAQVFTKAYVPGPSSPSSHGSFFTGALPSETGMHEANPQFTGSQQTIAEGLSDSHASLLISSNPYIFNGLDRGFDETNDLRRGAYMVFKDAGDPDKFADSEAEGSRVERFSRFLRENDKPVRSLVNAIQYKRVKRRPGSIPQYAALDDQDYQYAITMNERIREFVADSTDDSLVVANYMDVHPPFDASPEAIERFLPDTPAEDIPIGLTGQSIYERVQAGEADTADRMYDLYKAAIWDVDRKVTPLVSEFVDHGGFVAVTADHGVWFRRNRELDEERIHVPLLLFAPDKRAGRIDHTVSIRSLPSTTMDALEEPVDSFPGPSLFDVNSDQLSITEFIHRAGEEGSPVDATGTGDGAIEYDLATVKGDTRLDYCDGTYQLRRGGTHEAELRERIQTQLANGPRGSDTAIEYDETVKQRLEDFGYL